ncbi:MAG: hypothetical protein M3Y82_14935 [Verrucomicrobiota bacterium]|nr:hypothetical protein [Verrucomicrobiota bacterium]
MKKLLGLFTILSLLTKIASSVWAGTYYFANSNVITINDSNPPPTTASPYPSVINVSGIPANEKIDKITVTFHNLSHTFPSDIDILLVAPSTNIFFPPSLILFSDVGAVPYGLSGATITLDDEAAATLPPFGPIVSGVFKPTNFDDGSTDIFPGVPFPSSATNLSVFKGKNPNGTWRLDVVDDSFLESGTMAGGWSMTIRTAVTFANTNIITINDSTNPPTKANPYPSSIMVSNLIGNVIKVTATLHSFTHTFPDDVDILLAAPTATNLILMSDAGGGHPGVTNLTFTFDDSAAVKMSDSGPLTNGTYLPSNFIGTGTDTFPPLTPVPSSAANLSIFNGKNPNGTWNLYVVDDQSADAGQIANGWSLSIVTEISAPVIINPGIVGILFRFDWVALSGVAYEVQVKSDLSSPTWTTIPSSYFLGDGGIHSFYIDPRFDPFPKFFRVVGGLQF